MIKDPLAVLELGSTKVTCLVACEGDDGEVEVIGLGCTPSRGMKRGVVADIDAVSASISTAIREASRTADVEVIEVLLSCNGSHLEGQNARGYVPIHPRTRPISREDVLQVIHHSRQLMLPPDREQVQALPREFIVDSQRGVHRPLGMMGSKLEVVSYLVSGQTTHLQNAQRAAAMSGVKVSQMVVGAMASGLGVLTEAEKEMGTVSLDIGGGTADLAIFSQGSLVYAASIPIGGSLVTSDIANLIRTSPEEAERLKRQHGMAMASLVVGEESVDVMQVGQTVARPMQRRVLCEIIESRMRELATHVRQHLEKSGMIGVLPGGLVLSGGASVLPGTPRLFEGLVRNMPARLGLPLVPLPLSTPDPALIAGLAAPVGLALYGFQAYEDELAPASPSTDWREKVRTLWSIFGGKS